ncbi:hypothetical protein ACMBCM_07125, partial [Spiroplasma sp. K1]
MFCFVTCRFLWVLRCYCIFSLFTLTENNNNNNNNNKFLYHWFNACETWLLNYVHYSVSTNFMKQYKSFLWD